jgi:hypothetical protein
MGPMHFLQKPNIDLENCELKNHDRFVGKRIDGRIVRDAYKRVN